MHPEPETKIDGYAWRILLGPSHEWPLITFERTLTPQQDRAIELCELCREPIDRSKPFTTNSAGQQPIHTACLGGDHEVAIIQPLSKLRMWAIWLLDFLGVRERSSFAPAHNE
jgi:hypothetical protein